jgi:hypothetical protein
MDSSKGGGWAHALPSGASRAWRRSCKRSAPTRFASPDRRTPAQCTLRFTAVGPGSDPTPTGNVIEAELQVLDRNDF